MFIKATDPYTKTTDYEVVHFPEYRATSSNYPVFLILTRIGENLAMPTCKSTVRKLLGQNAIWEIKKFHFGGLGE